MEAALLALRGSLAAYEKGLAEIVDYDASKARLDKEIADYLATVDPRDAKAVGLVSIKRTQSEILPAYKEREEERQDARGKAMGQELEEVLGAILACAAEETGAVKVIVQDAIRPLFPPYLVPADPLHALPERLFDPVPGIAAGSALVFDGLHVQLALPPTWHRPEGDRLYRNEAGVRAYDRELIDRAKYLLGIYHAWLDNGRSFLRHRLPKLPLVAERGTWNAGDTAERATPQSAATTLSDAQNVS